MSISLTDAKIPALSWRGLIANGFAYGKTKGFISKGQVDAWRPQLDSEDLDDLLGAAEFMSRKLSAPHGDMYARWLENVFKGVEVSNREMREAIQALHLAGIPICTLNYDHLLEDVTGLPSVTLGDSQRLTAWMRREVDGVLHLHGLWNLPSTCVLGIRDYEAAIANDLRDLIQRSLGAFKRLLFIGCGETFSDPNFTALISWLREKMKGAALQHYALVTNAETAGKHADPTWRGFVEPIGYGDSHAELSRFLKEHFSRAEAPKVRVPRSQGGKVQNEHSAALLQRYRAFLLKDCGQMTIEGVRADMDIGQRKFDLERLFVPLKIVPCPPDIPKSDPRAEQKLREWETKNSRPIPFGKVFEKTNRIVLLALPGGGKTLLLKRLTVAYGDTQRLNATEDALPDLQITPILIRCREWRDHIKKPIVALLKSVPEIIGQTALGGLSDALLPMLKDGTALLLIDGLDEIHVDADRATFVEHLESFLEEFPLVRLVITSREAGFNLVAPSLSRFCERWRVAPLENGAIRTLCENWRSLMSGDSPGAVAEMQEVIDLLIRNSSLHRLAENPLLLTMLLVVRHGAGRLPPDRVSLYGRAVEILLDTWNIKGHDPLNLKESIPQLSFVAFQLMEAGKQTATEKELLRLLEEARERVPQIQRYAKDSPYDFLKRVELRSSLLLEAGHQVEGGVTVPFYQFRHLTFQEYLSAVAVSEGHYVDYSRSDSVLVPLQRRLTADEWKEVVPMAAVLARKQAEPLMQELLRQGQLMRDEMRQAAATDNESHRDRNAGKLPAAVSRLVQCLVEEAEATPETTTLALQLIAYFAKGCSSQEDWRTLAKGPYGAELLHHSILQFLGAMVEVQDIHTCTFVAAARFGKAVLGVDEVDQDILRMLRSSSDEDVAHGLFVVSGKVFERRLGARGRLEAVKISRELISLVEEHLFGDSESIRRAAMWAWAVASYHCDISHHPSVAALNQVLEIWLTSSEEKMVETASTALWTQLGLERSKWEPVIAEADRQKIRFLSEADWEAGKNHLAAASLVVAFHARTVWSDDELVRRLERYSEAPRYSHDPDGVEPIVSMLRQLDKGAATRLARKIRRRAKERPKR